MTRCLVPSLLVFLLVGCINPYEGSHMQFELNKSVVSPCLAVVNYATSWAAMLTSSVDKARLDGLLKKCRNAQGRTLSPRLQRFAAHFEIWATVHSSGSVLAHPLTVQPHLFEADCPTLSDADKDCSRPEWLSERELEKKGVLLANGRPLRLGGQSQKSYWKDMTPEERAAADSQMRKAAVPHSMTSFSLKMFQADGKTLAPDFYLGSHTQLSAPHNGTYYGQVEGTHPFGASTLTGGSTRVLPNLEDLDSLWVTIEDGDPKRPTPKPSPLVYLQGMAVQNWRGVYEEEARCPVDPAARASFAVIPSLGEEEYF